MSLREKQTQMTRELIKNAALELFCDKGIESADMVQIAIRSETSRRTLYHYYKDKEQLATEIYIDNLEKMFGKLLLHFNFETPYDSLATILDKYLELKKKHPLFIYYDAIFNVYYGNMGKNPADLPAYKQLISDETNQYMTTFGNHSEINTTETIQSWIETIHMVTHLFFCYLQKSVITSRQQGDLGFQNSIEQDIKYKNYILKMWIKT